MTDFYNTLQKVNCIWHSFQNTYFIQSVCSASLSFIFVNLILFDGTEVGAKAFFLLVSSAMYAALPGYINIGKKDLQSQ